MKNRFMISLFLIVISIAFVQPVFAAKKANARKGKYLFRKHCRSCHVESGSAKALSPISKTQAQWTAVFADGGFEKLECKANWDQRSEKDLRDMYAYMHDHAYDSPSPLKCK